MKLIDRNYQVPNGYISCDIDFITDGNDNLIRVFLKNDLSCNPNKVFKVTKDDGNAIYKELKVSSDILVGSKLHTMICQSFTEFEIDIDKFRSREIKAKSIFELRIITKNEAYDFIKTYHYLKDAKFFCQYAVGLFYVKTNELIGCATYSNPQGIASLKGWFGLTNDNKDILELSRLCMLPILNGSNATSYLLSNSIKMLKQFGIRAVTTLADSGRHIGSIYQNCNFKYYGLTDAKTDFYTEDGRLNPRGSTKTIKGVWLPRTRKHRYCYILDPTLHILYDEKPRPTIKESIEYDCCGGTHKVFDKRFDVWYTCPKCTGNLTIIREVLMNEDNI